MFMRRGCLFGCGGWLVACVVLALLAWFVAVPRISDSLEDGLADSFSTIIAEEINPLHSRSELQQGAEVRFSFNIINREFQEADDADAIDSFRIRSNGDQIVIALEISDRTFDVAFVPRVTSHGYLELQPVDDGGWWQRQFMNVLSGGFEGAVNRWLDQNDVQLTGVTLEDDALVLSVTGK